jgi:hypothetical protein
MPRNPNDGEGQRALLNKGTACGGLAFGAAAMRRAAQTQAKTSQADAQYQDMP